MVKYTSLSLLRLCYFTVVSWVLRILLFLRSGSLSRVINMLGAWPIRTRSDRSWSVRLWFGAFLLYILRIARRNTAFRLIT